MAVILAVIIFVGAIIVTVSVGYFIGMVIAIMPFVSDLLINGVGVTKQQIPVITAWMAVLRLVVTTSISFRNWKELTLNADDHR
ncbi:hypothetical protein [Virgibacillus proomii]|uniref:hypothetical protein n=1 Tax=Virgibacillus proomii TaxID=84407 RepID=UPI001C0FFE5F|nr:hypothetical protein [Virgibacillus proomii]MBU5266257.1 hypothetical protein [Virgibacillus proomii]